MNETKTEYGIARASLELLYEVGREVASALDLRTVLHRVLFLSMKNIGAISGSIIVLDEAGQPAESAFLMSGQSHDHTALQLRVTYERGMAGWVATHREAVLIPDTTKDERWLRRPDDAENQTGAKSAVSAPILLRDKLLGVITLVHPTPGFFTIEHLELIKAIAGQAGTAIRNAQLFESLELAHRRYRELFEDSIDPILVTDRKGQVIEVNRQAEFIIGQNRDDLRRFNILDLQDVDFEKVGEDFKNLSLGEAVTYESTLRTHTGHEIPIQVYARYIQVGNELNLQWILRDITERKDLDHLREDLIAMVYHDLRSPLANIISSLEVLDAMFPLDADETVHSLVSIATRSTDRIQRLTNSLLDINRLEAGQSIGNRQPLNVDELVQEVAETVLPNVDSKDLALTWAVPPDFPEIFADADMLRRVLINLLENAIKFTPARGKIHISARWEGDLAEICVSDTGPGIPPADQERIFQKFTRLASKDGPRGLGLGLAYCRLAVQGHGGEIWVESSPGEGANFKFTMPVANPASLEAVHKDVE
jgi:two-component system, NtrC family, sensor histidine kinase KinB